MITWVLTEEPSDAVAMAIEVIEMRIGSEEEVQWVCPAAEPVQE